MEKKEILFSNEVKLIDNLINKRIQNFYSRTNSSRKKKPPLSVTVSPIQYKINLFQIEKNYDNKKLYPNYYSFLNKELNNLENKKNNLNDKTRKEYLSNFINYTPRSKLNNNNNINRNYTLKNLRIKNKNIFSNIDYLTNSIKLRKISYEPYLKTDNFQSQRNFHKLNYPHQKKSLLYYIQNTSPIQNKKINSKTYKMISSLKEAF